jgi:Tfp pilus assembly protein PilP
VDARLRGIVRSANGDLALLEAPDGVGYVLRAGDRFEGGQLVEIRRDAVVMEVAQGRDSPSSRVVLRLEARP